MRYNLFYFNGVLQDINEAKTWYKGQQPGLEKRFAESIKTAILRLQENPLAYAVKYKNIRVARPKTFPYGIHFYIDDIHNRISIIAIIHNKRHPEVSQKRT